MAVDQFGSLSIQLLFIIVISLSTSFSTSISGTTNETSNGSWEEQSLLNDLRRALPKYTRNLASKNLDANLFADNTNLTAAVKQTTDVEQDLFNVDEWLSSSRLVLSLSKTVQMNIKATNSLSDNTSFALNF